MGKREGDLTFGARLKELRQNRGFTQRELSERAGIDYTYLSKLENDRLSYTPSIKTLQALAKALEVDELTVMDWAGKIPEVLQSFARNEDAMQFFRRIADKERSPADWRQLTRLLDSQKGKK